MTSQSFTDDHDQLLRLAKLIAATVTIGTPDAMKDLPTHRMALSKLVNRHCGEEIAIVNARAREILPDPAKAAMVRRFHDELLAWRGDLMECNANWPHRKALDDPTGFLAVFRGLSDRLHLRVKWEERVFYPAIMGQTLRR